MRAIRERGRGDRRERQSAVGDESERGVWIECGRDVRAAGRVVEDELRRETRVRYFVRSRRGVGGDIRRVCGEISGRDARARVGERVSGVGVLRGEDARRTGDAAHGDDEESATNHGIFR